MDVAPQTTDEHHTFLQAAIAGLTAPRKQLPSQYLYDERGARLFDRICTLEDYYPTRTETALLRRHAAEIADAINPHAVVIEPGSGADVKCRILLDALERPRAYVPIDIAEEHLAQAAQRLRQDYPGLEILPITADFSRALPRLPAFDGASRVVFFAGSTIGNFEPEDAEILLRRFRDTLEADFLLIGVDLDKDEDVLVKAYDDSEGVSAAFNLNLLVRANRELGADFDLSRFRHQAVYNQDKGRIEMHIVSLAQQTVQIAGRTVRFSKGESIHTENSYKYTLEGFSALTRRAGWRRTHVWTDADQLFAVLLCARDKPGSSASLSERP